MIAKRAYAVLVCSVTLLHGVVKGHPTVPTNFESLFELANQLLLDNKVADAVQCYNKAIVKMTPGTRNYYISLGRCHEKLDKLELAVSDYQTALRFIDAQPGKTYVRLASVMLKMEKYDECVAHLISATKCHWETIDVNKTIIQGQLEIFRLKADKMEMLTNGHKETTNPEDLAQRRSSDLHNEREKLSTVLEEISSSSQKSEKTTLFEVDPCGEENKVRIPGTDDFYTFDADYILDIGNQFANNESNYSEAFRCYSALIKINPNEAKYYRNRAVCLKKLSMPNLAELDLERSLSLDANNLRGRFLMSLISADRNDFKQSVEHLEIALRGNSQAGSELNQGLGTAITELYEQALKKGREAGLEMNVPLQ